MKEQEENMEVKKEIAKNFSKNVGWSCMMHLLGLTDFGLRIYLNEGSFFLHPYIFLPAPTMLCKYQIVPIIL